VGQDDKVVQGHGGRLLFARFETDSMPIAGDSRKLVLGEGRGARAWKLGRDQNTLIIDWISGDQRAVIY